LEYSLAGKSEPLFSTKWGKRGERSNVYGWESLEVDSWEGADVVGWEDAEGGGWPKPWVD
jgi:hypothetical protein